MGTYTRKIRAVTLALLVVISMLSVAGFAGVAAAAGDTEVSVTPSSNTTGVNQSVTYSVVVADASDGISGYDFNVSVSDNKTAVITDVTLNGDPGFSNAADTSGGVEEVSVLAASTDFGNQTTDVEIATVEVTGEDFGTADVNVTVNNIDDAPDDAGSPPAEYTITNTNNASVQVGVTDVALSPTDQSAIVGDNVTYDVVVANASDDIGTYVFDVSTNDTSTATITDVALRGDPFNQTVAFADDNSSVSVAAVGTEVSGPGSVTIAQVTVSGESAGDAALDLTADELSNLEGSLYTIDQVSDGSVSIAEPSAVFNVSELSAPATVTEGENFSANATVTNTGNVAGSEEVEFRVNDTVEASQNVSSLDPGNSTTVTFSGLSLPDSGTFTHGVFTTDDNQTAEITVQPVASVTFDDQNVIEGASEVTVTSAQFGDGDDGEFVVVVHQVDNGSIGAKIGESGILSSGTQSNITVDLQALDGGINNLTQSQELVAMLHTANTSGGNNHGSAIVRDGAPVTDRANVTVQQPATFDVSFTVDNTTVETGEDVTITATVENTGDVTGSTTVEFNADGSEISNTTVEVDGGNSTTVSATTSFSAAGTHNVSVNDLNATDITVERAAPIVIDQPATDPDGDGRFEDVNGDGTFDIIDVQALFINEGSDAVQNNVEAFNFNNDTTVDILDVQALFNEEGN